jgi:hypothetical protein
MTRAGFPHSDIAGSSRICRSPTLFAAYHVLHRLPMPRHSSYALISLMKVFTKPWLLDKLHTPTMQISKNNVPANQDEIDRIGMVGMPGFEPGTSSLSGTRSNQLSYTPLLWRVPRGWRSLVEPDGLEPTTSCLQSRRSTN